MVAQLPGSVLTYQCKEVLVVVVSHVRKLEYANYSRTSRKALNTTSLPYMLLLCSVFYIAACATLESVAVQEKLLHLGYLTPGAGDRYSLFCVSYKNTTFSDYFAKDIQVPKQSKVVLNKSDK